MTCIKKCLLKEKKIIKLNFQIIQYLMIKLITIYKVNKKNYNA